MSSKSIPYLLAAPGFILLIVFLVLPLVSIIWPTFFDGNLTFASYIAFFQDSYNVSIFMRTLRISLIVTFALCSVSQLPIISLGQTKNSAA